MMARDDAFALEGLDELGQLAERKPVNCRGAVLLDLGRGLFLDRCNDNLHALRPRGIQHQEGKLAVAGDEADTL